jgi:KAP family P-loop domain
MTSLTLGDDLPKENPWQEDRLGYRPFAERLAKVIHALRAPNGYVIGLHGKWGSGKSTALNFVKAFLKQHNDKTENEADRIYLVDFRPWIISGHQDLIAAFFKVLSESFGNKPGFVSRQINRVARKQPTADALKKREPIVINLLSWRSAVTSCAQGSRLLAPASMRRRALLEYRALPMPAQHREEFSRRYSEFHGLPAAR